MHQRTRRLTECALLTAIAVILDLSSLVPLLGVVTVLLCALPATYIAMVHGMRWAVASTAAAAVILALTFHPYEGLSYLSLFAVTGLTLGWLARRGSSAFTILAGATMAVFLSMCVNVYVVEQLVGVPASERLGDGIREGLTWAATEQAALYHELGLTPTATPDPALMASIRSFMAAPLTLLLVMAFLVVYSNYLAAALAFWRFGLPWEPVPDPRQLRAPAWLAPFVLANMVWSVDGLVGTSGLVALAAYNVVFLGWAVVGLAGISLLICMMDLRRLTNPLARLALMALFLLPLWRVTIVAGALDAFVDFRRRAVGV